jgi:hypothetical protein
VPAICRDEVLIDWQCHRADDLTARVQADRRSLHRGISGGTEHDPRRQI